MPFDSGKWSFSGGEFSPELHQRVDIAKFATGARTLRNFTVAPSGVAHNRPGTHFGFKTKHADKKARALPFEFSSSQRYVIEAGDAYFRFGKNRAQIVKAVGDTADWATSTAYVAGNYVEHPTSHAIYYCLVSHTSGTFSTDLAAGKWILQSIYEVISPYSEANLPSVQYAQSADTLFMVHPSVRPKMLQRFGDLDWRVSDYQFTDGPFMLDNSDENILITKSATTGSITLTASAKPWVTGKFYPLGTKVTETTTVYECKVAHASGTFATDLAAGKWVASPLVMFASTHVGSLWKFRDYIPGQAVTKAYSAAGLTASIKCGGTWRIITHGTWTGNLDVEKSTDGGVTWTMVRRFTSAADHNPNTYGDDANDGDPYLVRLNMSAYTSGTCNADLTSDSFWQTGVARITAYSSATSVTALVERDLGQGTPIAWVTSTAYAVNDYRENSGLYYKCLIAHTSGTFSTDLAANKWVAIANPASIADWAEGAWSDYRGWPSAVTFNQDRLTFAGTTTEPYAVWMTETGNYYSYRRKDPLTDSDGISVNLPSRKLNSVNGLVPLKTLVAFTTSGDFTIRSSSGSALSAKTVENEPNEEYGSNGVMPVVIGNRCLYVQASGAIVRDTGYSLNDDAMVGANLSVFSSHLFKNKEVTDMAYQSEPDSLVWCCQDDGKFLSLTYMREQEVVAWTRHDTNNSGAPEWVTGTTYVAGNWVTYEGETYKCGTGHTASALFVTDAAKWTATDIAASVESMCSIQGDGYKEVWFETLRNGVRYMEYLDNRMSSTDPEDQFFVDCGIIYDGAPASVITGLEHLEGMAVAVLADGNVLHNYYNPVYVTGGQITLDAAYSKVIVGIPYLSDLATLNVELQASSGTIQGKKIHVPSARVMLLESKGGMIGPDFDNLFDIVNAFPEYYDVAADLYTGTLTQHLNGGFKDNGGMICLRQADPLPFSVAAVVPSISVGG
jgi:hypothetical protein